MYVCWELGLWGGGEVGLQGEVEREECAICKTAESINLKGGNCFTERPNSFFISCYF